MPDRRVVLSQQGEDEVELESIRMVVISNERRKY